MSNTETLIKTSQLTKRYGRLTALDSLELNIGKGSLFGFIGPNGAGKTTTLRLLAGLIEPTNGQIWLNGQEISHNPEAARWQVGYMPDFFGVYEDMKVWEYLDFFARCYRLAPQRRERVVNELLELVDLAHKRHAWVESLSRGMRQRLCLAHALVHDPQILLLDEPASGLDPRARVEMRELLKELSKMGKTIIISSHILSELAEMCNDIGIIETGHLIYSGSVKQLQKQLAGHHQIQLHSLSPSEAINAALAAYPAISTYQPIEQNTQQATTTDNSTHQQWQLTLAGDEEALADLLSYLIQQNIRITQFSQVTHNLESVFMQITTGEVN